MNRGFELVPKCLPSNSFITSFGSFEPFRRIWKLSKAFYLFCVVLESFKTICINSISTNVPLLYPLKTSENLRFSDVYGGYKSGTLVEMG